MWRGEAGSRAASSGGKGKETICSLVNPSGRYEKGKHPQPAPRGEARKKKSGVTIVFFLTCGGEKKKGGPISPLIRSSRKKKNWEKGPFARAVALEKGKRLLAIALSPFSGGKKKLIGFAPGREGRPQGLPWSSRWPKKKVSFSSEKKGDHHAPRKILHDEWRGGTQDVPFTFASSGGR